jgi:hypothetical protein
VTPPTWLDAAGRRRPTLACWTCGREVAPMRYQGDDLRRHGWTPPQTLQIPDWCGCSLRFREEQWHRTGSAPSLTSKRRFPRSAAVLSEGAPGAWAPGSRVDSNVAPPTWK